MSVINKMLRDLDARRTDAGPGHPRQASPAAMEGTASVLLAAPHRAARWSWVVLLLVLTGAAAYWYLGSVLSSPPSVPPPVAADPPALAPVSAASAPEAVGNAPAEAALVANAVPVVVEPEPMAPAVASPRKKGRAEVALAETPSPLAVEKQEKPNRKRTSSQASDTGATPPGPAAPAAAPAAPATAGAAAAGEAPQRRLGLAQETLAQAQLLWNAGSREPALELVREAVAVVERGQPVDVPVLAPLVREQVRMELALGRPAAVLGLLSRLEPALSGQADLWAVRGNAAQRLGRHQESVQSYLAALQMRPGEARWMLGAAVSMAALGQLDAAAQQAEQARALGPVSPEVLTYLRQAGVPLR